MTGYSFWCSGCKKDHSGECPPVPKVPSPRERGMYPAEGSVWRKQLQLCGRGDWRDGITWKVDSFDAAESHTVVIRATDDHQNIQIYPVEAWDAEGVSHGAPGSDRVRFVLEAP